MNHAKNDEQIMLKYLASKNGKAYVSELFQLDNLENLRIYPLIYRLREKGILEITEYSELGSPLKIKLLQ